MERKQFARALTLCWAAALVFNLVPVSALELLPGEAAESAPAAEEYGAETETATPLIPADSITFAEPTEPQGEILTESPQEEPPAPTPAPPEDRPQEPLTPEAVEAIKEELAAEGELAPAEIEAAFRPAILRIIADEDTHTHTYRFLVGEEVADTQILSQGETLTEPPEPQRMGELFEGWYDSEGNACDFTTPEGALEEDAATDYIARFSPVYYVFYMSAPVGGTVLYTQQYRAPGEVVEWGKVPFAAPAEQVLTGWSLTPNGPAETEIRVTGASCILYPVLVQAHWLNFHTMGGTPVSPVYLQGGEPSVAPAEPTRKGYTFGGWYRDMACTVPFVFGAPVEEDTDLYAAWHPAEVEYRVAYWQQNADDDGYSLADTETRTGSTVAETSVTAAADRYADFTLREQPAAQTIAADGSTVVHVYYDRKIYEVKFYDGSRRLIPELTITARYGADISRRWPSRVDRKWPNLWRISYNGNTTQAGISTMPSPNDATQPNAFYYRAETSTTEHEMRYYLQGLDGVYVLDHTDIIRSSSYGWRVTANDFYAIKGFSPNWELSPALNAVETQIERGVYGWKLYYDRNIRTISFYNSGTHEGDADFLYGAPVAEAYYEPQPPAGMEGYIFTGWYRNELCQGDPYDFAHSTMADDNFPLYAGWQTPVYTVEFDLNGGTAHSGAFSPQTVERYQLAVEPSEEPERQGYRFGGWNRNGEPFSFACPIGEDTVLQAVWVSSTRYTLTFDPGAGSGDAVEAAEGYTENARAGLILPPETWAPPADANGFICWNTRADGRGDDYRPEELFTMPPRNVTLYARWGQLRTTTLTYDYNGGIGAGGSTEATETITIPNAAYTIGHPVPARAGYRFIGWSRDAAGSDPVPLFQMGSVIRVDTIDGENNRLYAQWEAVSLVTVYKLVEGNQGERERPFTFYYSIDGGAEQSFTLRHGENYTLPEMARDSRLTLREEDYSAEGYTTARTEGGTEAAPTVTFTNTRQVEPPTGLFDDSRPMRVMFLLGLGILGRGWELSARRRRRYAP